MLPHPPYSPDLAPRYCLDMKNMQRGKKFRSNEEVIVETEAYFEILLHKEHGKIVFLN